MGACVRCPDGATRNGVTLVQVAEPPRRDTLPDEPDEVQARRDAVLTIVRRDGRARLRDVVAELAAKGLTGGRHPRCAERVARGDLSALIRGGRIRKLRRGVYGRHRESAERAIDEAARRWAETRPRPWRLVYLQHALLSAGLDLRPRPRGVVHRAAARLVDAGWLYHLGDGFYLSTMFAEPAPVPVLPLVIAPALPRPAPRATGNRRRAATAVVEVQLCLAL